MREIRTRARTNSFRVITALLVVVAIAGPAAIALWPDGEDEATEVSIGLAGDIDPVFVEQLRLLGAGRFDVSVVEFGEPSEAKIDEALSRGDIDVAVAARAEIVWNETVDRPLASLIGDSLQRAAVLGRGGEAGLSNNEVAGLFAPVETTQRFVDETDVSSELRAIAFVALFTAFMLPQVFGQLTMMSVIEEKSTGVIEVLLSHMRPRNLLFGKVAGLSVLALPQLLAIMIGLLAAMSATESINLSGSLWQFAPVLLLAVLGGVVFYNTLFALLGSLVSRQEDASQVMMPVFVPLMAGFFVGQSAVGGSANTLIARIMTFIPFTSPMLLPVRVARSAIEPWEVAVSLLLLILGAWILVRIAARVYEFALLHSGSRVRWGQLWLLIRGGELV